jgi:excinuclease ABC subunit C
MTNPANYRPSNIPELPGVYRFFNEKDQVIYVGKAINLKARLGSYFSGNLAERTHRMVHQAVRVDWTIVNTEVEALQLEFSWIKQFNPTFNVQFRDDKSYPYLALSQNEKFPRLFITRKEKRPGLTYFGPFAHTWALRTTFDVLLKVFPVRSCTNGNFEKARRSNRPCLLGDIGKCAAPCVGRISESDHADLGKRLIAFMKSGSTNLIPQLEAEMDLAAKAEEFERAAKLRDQIGALTRVQESTDATLPEDLNADAIAIHEDGLHSAASRFIIRGGAIKGSRSWLMHQESAIEGNDQVTALFFSIYGDALSEEIPREILVNQIPLEKDALELWLSERAGHAVEIRTPQRGEKAELLATVKRNAQYSLIQYVNRRSTDSAVSGAALQELERVLEMAQTPLRIECFDISNISGTSVVASMVVFEDGLPKKSDYRRFIIDTDTAWDDTRAMHQVLTRRLKRLLDEEQIKQQEVIDHGGAVGKFAYRPHLIVVDGGAPQVGAAARALKELGITDIALCGLAKRLEEVWLPGESDPLILPRSSEGLYLLQRLRDEAHRFAITFHRSRRSKVMLDSLLDEIPQLGEVRRKALLEHFGSVAALRKADVAAIAVVPGIGASTAKVIVEHLAKVQGSAVDVETGEIVGS